MISERDLESLLSWQTPQGRSIVSFYLDRKSAQGLWSFSDWEPIARRMFKELETRVSEGDRSALEQISQSLFSRLSNPPRNGRSLVAFAGSNGDANWVRQLPVPIRSQIHWGATPYVRPLIEALEEYDRYAVALTDKKRARLFTVFLGEIEEERDAFNPKPVKHVTSTGTDQALTMNLQRRSEEHTRWHLKHVAELLDSMERARRFDRLILGGPPEAAHGLRRLLSKRIASRIVGVISLPIHAQEDEVLRETLELERHAQLSRQQEQIEELETASAKGDHAVTGLEPTLEALYEARVWKLFYVENLVLSGRECPECGNPFLETATRPVEDLIEKTAERVSQTGGRVQPMTDGPAERLRNDGGLGAFLRF